MYGHPLAYYVVGTLPPNTGIDQGVGNARASWPGFLAPRCFRFCHGNQVKEGSSSLLKKRTKKLYVLGASRRYGGAAINTCHRLSPARSCGLDVGRLNMSERPAPVTDAGSLLATAKQWLDAGEAVALATVVRTWGSSPRPAGSQMAVTPGGRMAGSVSGGCIEAAVAEAALATLHTGVPKLLSFGVTNERAWEVGLACGGQMDIFVEPVCSA